MLTVMSEDKTILDIQREQAWKPLDECPFGCGNTNMVFETPQGTIDCYRCGSRQSRPVVNSQVDLRDPDCKVKFADNTRREIYECFLETTKMEIEPGGSSKGPSRKKPVKRQRTRVEQDSFGGGPQRDKGTTKRLSKTRSKKFSVSIDCYQDLLQTQKEYEANGRCGNITTLVRSVLTAKNLTEIETIDKIEYGVEKHEFTLRFTDHELNLLESKARVYKQMNGETVTRGEILEALFAEFLEGVE